MAAPGALEDDVQSIVELIEHQGPEPDERQKHSPTDGFQGAYPMLFHCDMFAQRREEAFKKTEENLFSNHFLIHHKTQPVEQQEDKREEREQGEKCKRSRQTGAPMAKKRFCEIPEKTKGLHHLKLESVTVHLKSRNQLDLE